MNKIQQLKFDYLQQLMTDRRVVCTGNPLRSGTLASGFVKIFPNAIFLCRSTGWDLSNIDEVCKTKLTDIFSNCNTFLNCSYIAPGVQTALLELCNNSVKFCDVINLGSTHEYDGLGSKNYEESKINLRAKSLQLNSFRFNTCHLIVGGIKNDSSDLKSDWLDIDLICNTVVELWNRPYLTPIMSMDQHKEPW
jgi:hypothetical protein